MEQIQENFVEHKLAHCRQRYNWDCGLACVAMLLQPADREYMAENMLRICEEEGCSRSVWTIDLCHVLARFGVPHAMFTAMAGVNDGFGRENYYSGTIREDRCRVARQFARAAAAGVRVTERPLRTGELLRGLRAGPALVLVDSSYLLCTLCKYNKLSLEFRSCLPMQHQYTGHYVLLVGYNLAKRQFLYRNPSLADRLCAISFQDLERARTSFGTDEDVICVFKSFR